MDGEFHILKKRKKQIEVKIYYEVDQAGLQSFIIYLPFHYNYSAPLTRLY